MHITILLLDNVKLNLDFILHLDLILNLDFIFNFDIAFHFNFNFCVMFDFGMSLKSFLRFERMRTKRALEWFDRFVRLNISNSMDCCFVFFQFVSVGCWFPLCASTLWARCSKRVASSCHSWVIFLKWTNDCERICATSFLLGWDSTCCPGLFLDILWPVLELF